MKLFKNGCLILTLSLLLAHSMALPSSIMEEESLRDIRLYTKADKRNDFDYDLANTEVTSYGNEPLTDEIDDRPYKVAVKRSDELLSTANYPIRFFKEDRVAFPRFCALALLSLAVLLLMCFKLYKIKRSEKQRFQYRLDCECTTQELKPLADFGGNITEDEDTIFEVKEIVKTKPLMV